MRRIVFTVLASGVLLAVGSSVALAEHHGGRHERRHELAHHRREARHRRHEARHHSRIRHERWGRDDASTTTAGTVATFNGGILSIRLNDGSTVSGRVTSATEIECEAMEASALQAEDRGDDGDRGDGGDDGDRGDATQSCTTGALAPGTAVHEAELRVAGAGAIWDKVELIVTGASDSDS